MFLQNPRRALPFLYAVPILIYGALIGFIVFPQIVRIVVPEVIRVVTAR